MRRLMLGAVATALVAGGCASGPVEPPQESTLSWAKVESHGWDDAAYAVSLSSPLGKGSNRDGYLALVGRDGTARFVRTGPADGARIAQERGTLCAASESTNYQLSSTSGRRWKRSGEAGSPVAAFRLDHGSCAFVIANGTNRLSWGTGSRWSNKPVLGGTDQFGVHDGVLSSVSPTTDQGDGSLGQLDLASGRERQVMSWAPGGPQRPPGAGSAVASAVGDGIFSHRGRLFFLEEVRFLKPGTDTVVEVARGVKDQLRLGELDPVAKSYRSTVLHNLPEGMFDGTATAAAVACSRASALQGSAILTCDSDGNIVAVDVESRSWRSVGRLSDDATGAADAAAAFAPGRLVMFPVDHGGRMRVETYDLRTGRLVSTKRVAGMEKLIRGGVGPWSAAVLDPAPTPGAAAGPVSKSGKASGGMSAVAERLVELGGDQYAGLRTDEANHRIVSHWVSIPEDVRDYARSKPEGITIELYGPARYSRNQLIAAIERLADDAVARRAGISTLAPQNDGSGLMVDLDDELPSAALAAEISRVAGLPAGAISYRPHSPVVPQPGDLVDP